MGNAPLDRAAVAGTADCIYFLFWVGLIFGAVAVNGALAKGLLLICESELNTLHLGSWLVV
jgi:hypothetical protein